MELWIRSQDKMALAKFDLCILEKYDDKYMFIADHYKNMGTYKTKERALEVLDEIQEHIENQGQSFAESNEYGIVTNYKYYGNVYIMPKE